jgi:hypothetical protein
MLLKSLNLALTIRTFLMKYDRKKTSTDQKPPATPLRRQGDSLSQPAPARGQLPFPSAQTLKDQPEGTLTPSLVCLMEETIARSRQLLQEMETLHQERRAARERQAELPASPRRKRAS